MRERLRDYTAKRQRFSAFLATPRTVGAIEWLLAVSTMFISDVTVQVVDCIWIPLCLDLNAYDSKFLDLVANDGIRLWDARHLITAQQINEFGFCALPCGTTSLFKGRSGMGIREDCRVVD